MSSLEFADYDKYCGSCDYLSYTEKEQEIQEELTGRKPDHYCYRYEVKLWHMDSGLDHSPKIVKDSKCRKG